MDRETWKSEMTAAAKNEHSLYQLISSGTVRRLIVDEVNREFNRSLIVLSSVA